MIILFKNVAKILGAKGKFEPRERTKFDDVDIILLDNNLGYLRMEGPRHTADSVAGYIQAFTTTPYVVSLNKNPDVDFDLRYLIGDYTTRADLALNTKHLSNPAIWTGRKNDAKDGFLPWYWPNLLKVADKRRRQIDFVSRRLKNPVLTAYGFDRELVNSLSRHAKGALSPEAGIEGTETLKGVSPDEVT